MYSYKRSIELSKQDLQSYPTEHLALLGGAMGIPLELSAETLAENIATVLIDRHWRGQRAHMTEAELPYGGDIVKAMHAQDRPAIIRIQQWRDAQAAERGRELARETEQYVAPEGARECMNRMDLISQEDWTVNHLPDVKLELWAIGDPITGARRTLCFERTGLEQWLDNPSHTMSIWIPNQYSTDPLDDDGYGGGPGLLQIQKLPDGTFVIGADRLRTAAELAGIPIATNVRIGNQGGTFGVSALHGQAPGKTVYLVVEPETAEAAVRTSFGQALTERQVPGGLRLLGELPSSRLSGAEVDERYNEILAEAITHGDTMDIDRLKGVSDDQAIRRLARESGFARLINNFDAAIDEGNEEQAAEDLKEIFEKIIAERTTDPSRHEDAYHAILSEYYPDWMDEEMGEFISAMTFPRIIKSYQELFNSHPSTDADYDDEEGHRVGPGVQYVEEEVAEVAGEAVYDFENDYPDSGEAGEAVYDFENDYPDSGEAGEAAYTSENDYPDSEIEAGEAAYTSENDYPDFSEEEGDPREEGYSEMQRWSTLDPYTR